MTATRLRAAVDRLNQDIPNLIGCALVEVATGMVWHSAGKEDDVATVAEAASDYWRLYDRLDRHFETLGQLQACILMHEKGRITLLPCGKGMLFMTVSLQNAAIDWDLWQQRTSDIAHLVKNL